MTNRSFANLSVAVGRAAAHTRGMTNPQLLSLPDGRVLEAWDSGPTNGPVLVFHHGSPSSGIAYDSMRGALVRHGIREIAFSRPGYGDSTRLPGHSVAAIAADMAAVLDAKGIDRVYVAGWSGGGPHALACAALLGDRVIATAIIAGVAPYVAEGLDWSAGMGAENIEEFGAAAESPEALTGFMERAWPIYREVSGAEVAGAFGDLVDDVDRGSLTSVFAEDVARSFRDGLRNGYGGWFDDDLAFVKPWGFDVGAINGRVHIWQGEHDRMVPFAHGQWLAAHIPGAVSHLYPEHGHLSLVVDSFDRILGELLAP